LGLVAQIDHTSPADHEPDRRADRDSAAAQTRMIARMAKASMGMSARPLPRCVEPDVERSAQVGERIRNVNPHLL
jgi:hypothetical protein